MTEINNKYFKDVEIEKFDYWEKYPERRRLFIIFNKNYKIYDEDEIKKSIYDAGKLNSFIKVVNDKLYLAKSWSKTEEKYRIQTQNYISFKKPATKLNEELFRNIFYKGTFFNIEIFKAIITLGIQQHGIDKIIFKRMPYKLPIYIYKRSVKDAETFKCGKDYAVVISIHNKIICVAMWDFCMPYY